MTANEEDVRARRLRARRIATAVMAAACIGGCTPRVEPEPEPIGAETLELRPSGAVTAYDRFAWSAVAGKAIAFELTVYADLHTGVRGEVLAHERTERREWTFDAATTSSWPDAIIWQVKALDRSGQELSTVSQWSRRSRE